MITVRCNGWELPDVRFYVGAYYLDPYDKEVYIGVDLQAKDTMLFSMVSLSTGRARTAPRELKDVSDLTKGLVLYHRPDDEVGLEITLVK